MSNQDSPLSITASVAGILTFVYALIAGSLGYAYILRSYSHSETDIQRFYEAFSACALESDLVRQDILASHSTFRRPPDANGQALMSNDTTSGRYLLDPDSLARLFEHVRAVEIDLQKQAARVIENRPTGEEGLVGKVLGRGRWLSRSSELGTSLEKREALTARLLVVQMSLVSAKIHSQTELVSKLERQARVNEEDVRVLKERLIGYERSWGSDREKAISVF